MWEGFGLAGEEEGETMVIEGSVGRLCLKERVG